MTRAGHDSFSVLDTAMHIIQVEHRHFMDDGIDNEEHVQRIVRIAEAVRELLQSPSRSKKEIEADIQRIIRFGRQLFVDEWMRVLPTDTEPPEEQDAIEEFEGYVKKYKNRKRKKPSNKAL